MGLSYHRRRAGQANARLAEKFAHAFGAQPACVEPSFSQHLSRQRMDHSGRQPGAGHLEAIAGQVT